MSRDEPTGRCPHCGSRVLYDAEHHETYCEHCAWAQETEEE